MLADMQRVRMLAWELSRWGWDFEILSPGASEVRQDAVEADSDDFFPAGTICHEVGSMCRRIFETAGSRTHAWRTLFPIYQRGRKLLASGRFDLVYFSTTTFVYFAIGPIWQRRFNIPYVLDFHDPWVKDQPVIDTSALGWRRRVSEFVSESLERSAVVNAAGLVAVSPRYIEILRNRYKESQPAWQNLGQHAVIPFGVLEQDFVEAHSAHSHASCSASEMISITYVGAGGPIMVRGFTLVCQTLATLREKGVQIVSRVRIRLFGTLYNWRDGDPKHLEEVAQRAGIGELVEEFPARVTYRRSLELLLEADGALVLGVDDSGYMPSKLFSYALSGKPLLALLHRESPAFGQFQTYPDLGHALWFDNDTEMPVVEAEHALVEYLEEAASRRIFDRRSAVGPYLAPVMAKRHAELFEKCLKVRTTLVS